MCTRTREKNSESADEVEWSAEEEIQLFFALVGLKPVGINKHFFMACICDRLSKALNRDISTDMIWSHLKSMYNLKALDELEKLPFPNKTEDFALPETEFNALIVKKKGEVEEQQKKVEVKPVEANSKMNKTPVPIQQGNATPTSKIQQNLIKEIDKKVSKLIASNETPKRTPKRTRETRGSMSVESNSPSTTPPPTQSNKRRRI